MAQPNQLRPPGSLRCGTATGMDAAEAAPQRKESGGLGWFGWAMILGLCYLGWRLLRGRLMKPKAGRNYTLGD